VPVVVLPGHGWVSVVDEGVPVVVVFVPVPVVAEGVAPPLLLPLIPVLFPALPPFEPPALPPLPWANALVLAASIAAVTTERIVLLRVRI